MLKKYVFEFQGQVNMGLSQFSLLLLEGSQHSQKEGPIQQKEGTRVSLEKLRMKYNIVLPATVCGVKGIGYLRKKEDVVDKIQMFQSLVFPEGLEDTAQQGPF